MSWNHHKMTWMASCNLHIWLRYSSNLTNPYWHTFMTHRTLSRNTAIPYLICHSFMSQTVPYSCQVPLPQPANHFFIRRNLLRIISTEISHACRSLCWSTYNTALECGYYRLIIKLLANLVSQLTCRMLLAGSLTAHGISSATHTSALP